MKSYLYHPFKFIFSEEAGIVDIVIASGYSLKKLNLPLTQAPVNGSHGIPGGQCAQESRWAVKKTFIKETFGFFYLR